MQTLPHNLYSAELTRQLDRLAIEGEEIPGIVLMERAGQACFDLLDQRWPDAANIAILCGGGNNGGDGFVVASLAQQSGRSVSVMLLADPSTLKGEALDAYQAMVGEGIEAKITLPQSLGEYDLIVDALLGTGLSSDVRGVYAEAIQKINSSGKPVVAVDIPSGLSADTGSVLGCAVKASATISFIGLKQGLLTGAGPELCGDLHFADLAVPRTVYQQVNPSAQRIDYEQTKHLLSKRPRDAHKGNCGHVLLVGGDHGMSGAVRMAGEAALRSGAGLVSVATRIEHALLISMARPELMCHGIESRNDLDPLLARASALAIGPGLGQGSWGQLLFHYLMEVSTLPMVIDADGLNLLAQHPMRRDDWILTPHVGEAARLLNTTIDEIQQDRFAAIRALQNKYGGHVLLKGAGTLICDPDGNISLCSDGNPGMASGGMGDVLTGVVVSLLGQGLTAGDAIRLGVCLHAAAGDRAAQAGERGLLASDLMPHLRRLVNP